MSYEPDFIKSYDASKYPGAVFKVHLDNADYVNILPMFRDSEVGAACYNFTMRCGLFTLHRGHGKGNRRNIVGVGCLLYSRYSSCVKKIEAL